MDTWCYFAPGLLAKYPGDLHLPFLGSFMGADELWAIHWPGAPWLYSMVFPWLPVNFALFTVIFLCIQMVAALGTAWLCYRLCQNWVAGGLAGLALLFAKYYYINVGFFRPEIITSLLLLLFYALMLAVLKAKQTQIWQVGALFVIVLATSLSHPLALPFWAAVCGLLILWQIVVYLGKGTSWQVQPLRLALTTILGVGSAVSILAFYFFGQPYAREQFTAHAEAGSSSFHDFPFQLLPFRHLEGFPNYGLELPTIYVALFLISGYLIIRILFDHHALKRLPERVSLEALFAFSSLVFSTTFLVFCSSNPYHIGMVAPLWTAFLFAGGYLLLEEARMPKQWQAALGCLIVLAALLPFTSRSYKYYQAGFPDIRQDLAEFYRDLPKDRLLLLPTVMWEEMAKHPEHQTQLALLPFNNPRENQLAYLDFLMAFKQPQPGDVLVIDAYELCGVDLAQADRLQDWVKVGSRYATYPGRKPWGFGLQVYEYRPSNLNEALEDNQPTTKPADGDS